MEPKKILVVEGDDDFSFMIKNRLEANGFHCTCVSEAKMALMALNEIKPDLVLLNLILKDIDGTAFLKHAKEWADPEAGAPPVIVLNGHDDNEEVMNYCYEHGATDFIQKNDDDSLELLSAVREHIL